jgi:MFS family permease
VSALEASAVVSVFALVRLISAPIAGAMVNRAGERTVLSSGLLIVSISSVAAGLSQNFGQLIVLRGIGGLGSSMFTVSAMALLLRVVDQDQRGRASSVYQSGFLIGGVAGPALGGLVVGISIRAPFFVYAGTLAIASVVTLIFLANARLHDLEAKVAGPEVDRMEKLVEAARNPAYRAAVLVNLMTGFVTLGLLAGVPVSVAHTETDYEIRVISFRKATPREAQRYFREVQD